MTDSVEIDIESHYFITGIAISVLWLETGLQASSVVPKS